MKQKRYDKYIKQDFLANTSFENTKKVRHERHFLLQNTEYTGKLSCYIPILVFRKILWKEFQRLLYDINQFATFTECSMSRLPYN